MDNDILLSVKRHLEGLRRTPEGAGLYKLIQRGLKRYGGGGGQLEQAFLTFLYSLLGRYASDPESDPSTRVKVRLIQQRLAIFLPEIPQSSAFTSKPPTQASSTRWHKIDALTGSGRRSAADTAPTPNATTRTRPTLSQNQRRTQPMTDTNRLKHVEQDFAEKISESLSGESLTSITSIGTNDLARLDKTINDINSLKSLVVRGLDELIKEREVLQQKLSRAGEYMRAVDADRKRLASELSQVQKHGLSDSITGLPRRDVFTRQLEAEIGRVRRYGFALSVALIDLDDFTGVNKRYGREAGDAVLRCYASEVLSKFRSYDLVARYGNDEFAILFPNTQKEGALKALDKARTIVAKTLVSFNGHTIPLPGFSSVLTLYSPGEQPASLLRRASEALDHAKLSGQHQTVVALPTQ
jgi:diguanylate cyclase